METLGVSPPPEGLCEYLLVAYPEHAVSEQVNMEKEHFNNNYRRKPEPGEKPHITIAQFWARELMEETMIRYTQRVCSQKTSFPIALNNFSGHPPHTIYLRVQDPQPILQLANELRVVGNYVQSYSFPAQLVTAPRINITQGLSEANFLTAMLHFSQKTFHADFFVTELVLLRKNHKYDAGKPIYIFRLQPSKQAVAQQVHVSQD
jgi:2'-5' RNA ligase